jgi:hypothetical protein
VAVQKDRVDHIEVSGERSFSFRKVILLGPLDLEDEGNRFLRNFGQFSSITQHHSAKYFSLQRHCCDNLKYFKSFHRFQMAESEGEFQRSSSQK